MFRGAGGLPSQIDAWVPIDASKLIIVGWVDDIQSGPNKEKNGDLPICCCMVSMSKKAAAVCGEACGGVWNVTLSVGGQHHPFCVNRGYGFQNISIQMNHFSSCERWFKYLFFFRGQCCVKCLPIVATQS
ncbi:hypothetical protein AVEN_188383-1 [Araneus ventricosus]|uniref:Uncharacterized protein n=1 Tax=Araneus ventricosus TaxID=182803 RepID=A0A4Y2ED64_ARAVE|nr:hypothetical protein AVEN_188383-1 [Araneus ventricosus]